jgi:two-component system OmpR family sensor kinase/two-component system sensor histidine kinase BaeS
MHRSGRPGLLFLRLLGSFGIFVLMVVGGLALLGFVFSRLGLWSPGDNRPPFGFLLAFCGLALLVPMAAGWIGRRVFRNIARPLADIMRAADGVAGGDLSVRVTPVKGDFGQLGNSFNHMVSELERADQRRRNLTADVAHELRTPLQIIQGNLEGVIDGVYQATPEHLAATLEETRLLARLVEDLRVLSQAEAGQLTMQMEAVNVAELVEDALTSFGGQAQAGGIALTARISGTAEQLTVQGDYGRLDQVLGNLLANALRHTPAGGHVTVGAALVAGTPALVRLTVEDTGSGIAAEALPFIFDRFWKADKARSHSAGGSGLGLAIARQLVQAHGGRIGVESTVGKGTVFVVELPAAMHQPEQGEM